MLTIAGGVILGGLGLILALMLLPWFFALLWASIYALVRVPILFFNFIGRLTRTFAEGLVFCIRHPLKAARVGWEGSILRWWIREVF